MFSFRNPTPLWPKTFSWMDGTWRYWWVTGSSMPLGSSHWLSWLNSRSTFLSWLWSHFQLSSSFWPSSSHILLIWRMSTEFCKFNSLEWKDSFPRNRAWVCQEVKVDFIPYFSLNVLYIRSAIFTRYVCTASILMNVIWPRKNIRMWGKVYKVPSLFCVMTIINVLHQKNYMCTDLLQSAIFVIV